MNRHRREDNCGDFSYYDTAIPGCTQCDHLCDNHEIQGTTSQCIEKCYKYYQHMQQPDITQTTTGHVDPPSNSNLNENNAILAGVVTFVILGCIAGVFVWVNWKKNRMCCCWRVKGKAPVMCSDEEGLNQTLESQKSLLNSNGPIRQAEGNPHHEFSQGISQGDGLYPVLTTLGIPHRVLDEPYSTSNIYTILPRAYTESGDSSYTTNIVSSTVPKTYSEGNNTSNGTNLSSSTTPKVVYTREDETDMSSSRSGTIAETSLDLESLNH